MDSEKLKQLLLRLERTPSYELYGTIASCLDNMTAEESHLPTIRVAILRNFTFEPLLMILKSEIIRIGFFPYVYIGNYDAIASDVINVDSAFYLFKPNIIILAQWLETLAPILVTRFLSLTEDAIEEEVQRVLDFTTNIVTCIRNHSKAPILLNNFPLPDYAAFGILDSQSNNMQINTIHRLNRELLHQARELSDVYMVDYASLMARVGIQNGFDERYWHIGKAPISRHALLPFGIEYARFLRALTGRVFKCLILDCDNTLWGGTIGEEGLGKIKLGPTYPGSCYMSFQAEIMNLHDRGVILALCSKNNEGDVLEVLQKHPHMLLRENSFATWQINWDDKVTNIRRIVEELNIGMENVVFVDDNEYEIDLVKSQIPEITVLKLPLDASQFRTEISKRGYFDSLSFSQEDRQRNNMYRDEAQRSQLSAKATSMEEYLAQLKIKIYVGNTGHFQIPRVAQLTQKTNQFNLTTKRYTEDDIIDFSKNPMCDILYLKQTDKISDMGIVGVAIIRYCGTIADIDNFLLSCRAIGRNIEDALFAHIIHRVKTRGIVTLQGSYIPTRKNSQVADFYKCRGFSYIGESGKESRWALNELNNFTYKIPPWIEVVDDEEKNI